MSYGPTLLVGHDATGLCWLVYNLHRPVHLSPQVRLWLPTASHRRHFHQGFPALMFGDCFLRGPGPTRSEGMHAQDRENPGLPAEARGGMLWRWGESNPRPMAGPEFFSERSLRFYFSAPSIAQTHRQIGSVD